MYIISWPLPKCLTKFTLLSSNCLACECNFYESESLRVSAWTAGFISRHASTRTISENFVSIIFTINIVLLRTWKKVQSNDNGGYMHEINTTPMFLSSFKAAGVVNGCRPCLLIHLSLSLPLVAAEGVALLCASGLGDPTASLQSAQLPLDPARSRPLHPTIKRLYPCPVTMHTHTQDQHPCPITMQHICNINIHVP